MFAKWTSSHGPSRALPAVGCSLAQHPSLLQRPHVSGCICDMLSTHAHCMLKCFLLVPLLLWVYANFCLPRHNLRLLSLKISPLPYAVIKQKEITLFRSPYEGLRMLFTHMKDVTSVWTCMKMGNWHHYGAQMQMQPHISLWPLKNITS